MCFTGMKQILINADIETHAWLHELARLEKRTLGAQVLYLLERVKELHSLSIPPIGADKPRKTPK